MLDEVFTRLIGPEDAQATIRYAEGAEPEVEWDEDLSMLERDELKDILGELARRAQEALRLFVPREPQRAFLESKARERLVRGGNRGGKTLVGAVMCARCVTGQQPGVPERDGKFIVVGKDLKHCGSVIYEKLFRPGAFKIIRDPLTNEWRVFDPSLAWDAANEDKAKPAPPLIPARYVKAIAWENKKDEIPKSVLFKNGWKLEFHSGEGAPRQGIVVDVAWFDEEIPHPLWYKETRARIIDRKGFFYWTATPQAGTLELYKLHIRAMELAGTPDPAVEEFCLSLLDNNFLGAKEKAEFTATLDEDEYRIRVLGDFALLGARVYPTFAPKGAHGIEPFPIPHDWCRYAAIDPGRQVCAVLFAAVPPRGHPHAGRVVIYDELHIKKCNARIFAAELRKKVADFPFHAFIIDHRAGRQSDMGTGKTVEQHYSAALKAERVECEKTGHKFSWGSDDVKAGIEAVQGALHLDAEGMSRFVFFASAVPHLCREMGDYSYRKTPTGIVTDEPVKLNDHLCFIAGTMVRTKRGLVPIERVRCGDLALTRAGWRRVVAAGKTASATRVVELQLSNGRSLVGTANHPIFVDGVGYTPMGELRHGDVLVSESDIAETQQCLARNQRKAMRSSTRGSSFAATRPRLDAPTVFTSSPRRNSQPKALGGSMWKSGRMPTGRFRQGITSTTGTKTRSITPSITWSAFPARTTSRSTAFLFRLSGLHRAWLTWMLRVAAPPPGMDRPKGASGTPGTAGKSRGTWSRLLASASTAARGTRRGNRVATGSAQTDAELTPAMRPASMLLTERASGAAAHSDATATRAIDSARVRVLRVLDVPGEHKVFNLTVEGQHEYLANGVLVSNCDCLRYLAMASLRYVKPRVKAKSAGYTTAILKRKAEKRRREKGGDAIRLG
jgi:hypothetical protein